MDGFDDKEFALEHGLCPKCGHHLDLIVRDGEDYLRCCNVKCRWECMPDVDSY